MTSGEPRTPLLTAAILAIAGFLPAQTPPDFVRDVLPIFQTSCFKCHQDPHADASGRLKKPKGDLRLDGKAWILRGGKGGTILAPGRPDDSELYLRTTLAPDDPDVMPSKGDPLTAEQNETLRRWIAAGASFGDWTGAADGSPKPPETATESADAPAAEPARVAVWRELSNGLRPLSDSAVAKAGGPDARVTPLLDDGPLLRVGFPAHESGVDDRRVAALRPLGDHLAELDLGRTAITDAALDDVARMKRLVRLDLNGTKITDRGLRALRGLAQLRTLNLFGTQVTDAGLGLLAEFPALEVVYLWQSGATPAGIARLRAARPELIVRGAPDLPAPAPADDDQPKRRKR